MLKGVPSQTVTLTVNVRDATLPLESHVLSLWGTQISEWDLAFGHARPNAPSVPTCNDSAFAGTLLRQGVCSPMLAVC